MSNTESTNVWTEEEWDPVAVARKKRAEMKNQMSKKAREQQQRYEDELHKQEEERMKQEEMKQLEAKKKEAKKKAKKEKKAKEAVKQQQEEKISLTYSKKELKKAEELKREKQREKDLKQKNEKKQQMKKVEEEVVSEPIKEEVIEKPKPKGFPFLLIMILSFLLFVVIIRYFPVYRTLMKVQPQQLKKLNQLVDSIRSLVGSDIVELSELKQEGNPVFKKMYLQINFKHFADLIQFYSSSVYSKLQKFIQSQ